MYDFVVVKGNSVVNEWRFYFFIFLIKCLELEATWSGKQVRWIVTDEKKNLPQ